MVPTPTVIGTDQIIIVIASIPAAIPATVPATVTEIAGPALAADTVNHHLATQDKTKGLYDRRNDIAVYIAQSVAKTIAATMAIATVPAAIGTNKVIVVATAIASIVITAFTLKATWSHHSHLSLEGRYLAGSLVGSGLGVISSLIGLIAVWSATDYATVHITGIDIKIVYMTNLDDARAIINSQIVGRPSVFIATVVAIPVAQVDQRLLSLSRDIASLVREVINRCGVSIAI